MKLFAKKDSANEPSLHEGHVAALGEQFARMVSQEGICHTAMSGDHIRWHSDNDALAVLGWSHTRKIQWPEQALSHADDIKVFFKSIGSGHTAALRLGYVFQWGPMGESIFFKVANEVSDSKLKDSPKNLIRLWKAPLEGIRLGKNSNLTYPVAKEITEMGGLARKHGEKDLAKQCFLRCYIAGLASGSAGQQYASIMNLISVYVDEQRWLRAFALCLLAMLHSGSLPKEQKDFAENATGSLYLGLSKKVEEPNKSEIERLITSSTKSISYPEFLWQAEDYEIKYELGMTTPSNGN